MRKGRVALYAGLAVGLAAMLAWGFTPRGIGVELAPARKGAFAQTIDEEGRTRVRERFIVSAPLEGQLARIALKAGDAVRSGDVVATIAPPEPVLRDTRTERELDARYRAAEAQAQRAAANVARAEAAEKLARTENERIASLATRGVVSAAERDAAAATQRVRARELESAREERHAAEHELEAARAAHEDARSAASGTPWPVRAPAAGTVLHVLQESATNVTRSAPLLEIGDPSSLEVVAEVLSSDAVSIRPGARVEFGRWGGSEPASGVVRLVERAARTKVSALGVEEQRVDVVIDVASTGPQWTAVGDGYRVVVRVTVAERDDALTVPVGALFRAGDEWRAFVAVDGRARSRKLTLGPRSTQRAVVESGLAPGDQVIVYPSASIHDGVRVTPRDGAG